MINRATTRAVNRMPIVDSSSCQPEGGRSISGSSSGSTGGDGAVGAGDGGVTWSFITAYHYSIKNMAAGVYS